MMDVGPRHTNVSWGVVTHGASLFIDVAELHILPRLNGASYNSIGKEIAFSGSDNDDNAWKAVFSNTNGSNGQVTVNFYCARRIYILEGEATLTMGETSNNYDCPKNYLHSGASASSSAICALPYFKLPQDGCQISFRVKYQRESFEVDSHRCFTPSRTVDEDEEFHASFEDLFDSGKNSDLTFVIGDQTVVAHKAILAARVPYFDKMISSGMKETQSGQVKVDELIDVAAFKAVLKYIYGGHLPKNLDEDAVMILPLADKYDLKRLKNACFFHMEKILTKENVSDTLILADLYRGDELKKKCLSSLRLWGSSLESDLLEKLKSHPHLMVEFIQSI